jgi:hypothetical protein
MPLIGAIAGPLIGGVASAVVGDALFGGGSSSGGYQGGSYLPPNLDVAAGNELNLIPQIGANNTYRQVLPDAQNAVYGALYSPYYGQALSGAQQAAQYGMQQGSQAANAANQLYGQMGRIPGLEDQLIQSAFDPQSPLYNYLRAQNANQVNADLAARGLSMSGAGAQIAAQQNQLFNQNWQDNLLNRQLAGVRGIGSLNQSAGQLGAVGASIGTQGSNLINQSAAMPYQTQMNSANSLLGMMNSFGQMGQQANVPIQQQIIDYNTYQGLGSPSSQLGQQGQLNQASQAFGATIAKPIGNAVGDAIKNWGSGVGGSSGGTTMSGDPLAYMG